MVDDLEAFGATMLVWSALGGGSLSLPYLEQEAYEAIPARMRMYGYMNDAEFIRECGRRGIDVFGIVFEVQGWEFPAELSAGEDEVLALNELRGEGQATTLGLREFNANTYPKLWKAWEEYFPDGLFNSAGERVTNILEECVSRDIHGRALHAEWVECPDREHFCYLMDRNNPVWREYLKAIIRIQIDAGVQGVQLDEAELPYTALGYGGCFCTECMTQFRAYLQRLDEAELPSELVGVDLSDFHYGRWLLDQGYDFAPESQPRTPLFDVYTRFQRSAIAQYFAEIAQYVRTYAQSKGREVRVTANLFNLYPQYFPFEPYVDVVVTEVDDQTFRQPAWNRYAAGFGRGKSVVAVENPYGGVVLDLSERLKRGKAYDLFRIMQYEAAALGVNMSLPYGAWMGSVVKDSFHPPHDLSMEVQSFFKQFDHLYSNQAVSETAVVFSAESAFRTEEGAGRASGRNSVFWRVAETLASRHQPYDVVWFPDGELREDTLTESELARYKRIVLPQCVFLTSRQVELVLDFMNTGGELVVLGELGSNLSRDQVDRIERHERFRRIDPSDEAIAALVEEEAQVTVDRDVDMAVNLHDLGDEGIALHFIRYDFDEPADEVPVLPELRLDVRLPKTFGRATAHSPASGFTAELEEAAGDRHVLRLQNVPVYGVVHLS
ncbi:hypothetical protein QDR37_09070 [Amnibacterium sp. CER49]|uniref:hypothetical protein n=1 Tax=Amnibacterium sp. CER49 TaxID=3039161 RepID=UPI00244B31F2|nr:hypothetical protein [Amnibacterium sp. CER49]MDH2444095.1 hypothetical protein [Amnibacterium sp. CER49]